MRCFVLGAGFSRPSGMPLAGELTQLLVDRCPSHDGDDEFRGWIEAMQNAIRRLNGLDSAARISVEELFYYGPSTAEMRRMEQHMCPVGRNHGLTPYSQAVDIEHWLGWLDEELVQTVEECERHCCLKHVENFCRQIRNNDVIISFNYDTLAERALTKLDRTWNHGLRDEANREGATILKLHGSIDWFTFARGVENPAKYELLFRKQNENGVDDDEDAAFELCRLRRRGDLQEVLEGPFLDLQPSNARWWPALGGLGLYKPLHRVPGLGYAWQKAGSALRDADTIVFIGFSLSPFDTMARLQLATSAIDRIGRQRQQVIVVDPSEEIAERYRKIYGAALETFPTGHENLDWAVLLN